MYAAQIGSELQKQFAILPGWFDIIHMHKVAVNYFKTYITFSSFWYVKNMRVDTLNPLIHVSDLVVKLMMNEWPQRDLSVVPNVQHGLD